MKHYKIKRSIINQEYPSINTYFKDLNHYKTLSVEKEKEMFQALENGNTAVRDKLIKTNLRFVISLAKQYQNRGIPLPDLIEAGNIGLIEAVDQYHLDYNVRFASYAAYKIRKHILLEIYKYSNLISIPYNKTATIAQIMKVVNKFEQLEQRNPTLTELAALLKLSEETVKEVLDSASITIVPELNVNYTGDIISVFDSLEDYKESPKDPLVTENIQDFLKATLNPIELKVINKSFGFEEPLMTIAEIGKELNVTQERIRQIKNKAILKLRKNPGILKFKNLLE